MGRLSSANYAQANAAALTPVHFLRIVFPSTTFRLHDFNGGPLTYGGASYVCDGTLLSIGAVHERADGKVGQLQVSLSAGNATLCRVFRDDDWHYAIVEVALGFLRDGVLVAEPQSFGSWYLSTGEWSDDSELINLTCEPVSILFLRQSLVTATNADQQRRYSGDTIFTHVAALDEKEIEWGGSRISVKSGAGSTGGLGGTVQVGTGFESSFELDRIGRLDP